MKIGTTVLIIGSMLCGTSTFAQMGGSNGAVLSPPAVAAGTINGVKVAITYSVPSVKGRKIYGGLEKFGSVWRAGANDATTMSFDKNVAIDGKSLAKGKYAFFILLNNESKWTIIFNKNAGQWGTEHDSNKAQDVLKVDVTAKTITHLEKLKYTITADGITFAWDTKEIHFKVNPK